MNWESIQQWIIDYVPKIVGVVVFLVVAGLVSGWVGRLVTRLLERGRIEKTLCKFLGNMAKWVVFLLAFIACLGVFGVETTSFAAIIGAATLAIGLAFQGSLGNVAAGVMLLIFRPFKVDDVVKVQGELGKVAALSLFTTELDTPDNRHVIIPNGAVFGSTMENITHNPTRRVDVNVGVEYPADLDRTREVLLAAAKAVPDILADPAPMVMLLDLGDSSVNWVVRVWTKGENYWTVRDATTRQAKLALDAAGLGIPFPQMDVHLHKIEA